MNWHNFRQSWKENMVSNSCTKIWIANLQISKSFDSQLWYDFRITHYLANSHSKFKFNAVIELTISIVRSGIFGVTLILFSLFCFYLLKYYFNKTSKCHNIHAHIFKLLFFKHNVHITNEWLSCNVMVIIIHICAIIHQLWFFFSQKHSPLIRPINITLYYHTYCWFRCPYYIALHICHF